MVTTQRAAQPDQRNDTWRLFAAVPVNDDVRALLADAQRQLAAHGWPVRWVAPALAHITLQFYGQTPSSVVPELVSELSAIAGSMRPLTLTTGAVGVFPSPARPRVLWLGLAGDLVRLDALVREVATTSALVPNADAKPFTPHITLGRVRERGVIHDFGQAIVDLQLLSVEWPVTAVELVHSTLGAAGPTYTTLAQLQIGDASRPKVREHG